MMDRQLQHLTRLVDDLLDVSRITSGRVELRRGRFDLQDVIGKAIELTRPLVELRRHELIVERTEVRLPIDGDFDRLVQIVGNLLTNAAKYTPPGGTITLRTGIEGNQAVVRVRDTGMGIPAERLEALFEMFSQVPEHRMNIGGGGLGIGLALAQRLVALHGGSIEAHSEGPGSGSELIVRLPLAALFDTSASATRAASHATPRPTSAHADPRRVLIVDDNVDAAESLRLLLELDGHVVEARHDGPSALTAITSFAADVVLLDIGLPRMDGYEVARRLRALPRGRDARLYAVTGWGQAEDKRRALEAGFDGHLTKPINRATLQRAIADDST